MDFETACRKAKYRNARRFVQDRVWRWLKRQPQPVRVAEAVAALGISERAIVNCLSRLREKGHAVRTGRTHQARWVASGKLAPVDLRGTPAASIANLRTDNWVETLMLANIARGYPQNNVSLSRRQGARSVVPLGRDGAPRENVGVPSLADLCGALVKAR